MILPHVWSNPYCLKETKKNTLNIHLDSKCAWIRNNIWSQDRLKSIPVAPRSRAWVCDRSFVGFAGSNPIGGMHICLVNFVCCQVEVSALGWSPRSYESCRVLCHWVWTWSLDNDETLADRDCRAMEIGKKMDWSQEDVVKDCTVKRLMILLNRCCP